MTSVAPFTRILVFVTVGLLLANRILSTSNKPRQSSPLAIISPGLSHALLYQTTGEHLLSALVLYQLRGMEVACGPAKYGGLVMLCGAIGYALQAFMHYLYSISSTSGLHPIIFGSLVGYYLDVPRLSSFSLFGVWELSDKSFIYGMASHLLLLHGWRSVTAGLSGIVAGYLYFVFVPSLQQVVAPGWVVDICS